MSCECYQIGATFNISWGWLNKTITVDISKDAMLGEIVVSLLWLEAILLYIHISGQANTLD